MSLVGDILLSAREAMIDMPAALATPSITSVTAASGGSLSNATYYVKITALSNWGESSGSSELTVATSGANNSFSVVFPALPGATSYRVYFGTSSGAQNQYVSGTASPISVTALGTAGSVPTRSSAWLPDTDGDMITANTLYRWLNDGLRMGGQITGGIRDMSGVGVVSNQVLYPLTNQWYKIEDAWYDGWPLQLGSYRDTFQKNRVTGLSATLVVNKDNDISHIELYPLPSRAAAVTTITADVSSTATTFPIASSDSFLDRGMFKIENEIVFYSAISGTNLVSCQRGMGGTNAAAHSSGATVTELNIRFIGYRQPEFYTVGSSLSTLTVPAGWEPLLQDYLVGRFRMVEQNLGEGQQLIQGFTQGMMKFQQANKPLAGPRQMGGVSGLETGRKLGSLGGGVIIP